MKKRVCVLLTMVCLLLFNISAYAESTSKVDSFNGGTVQAGLAYTNVSSNGTTTYSRAGGTTFVSTRTKVFNGSYAYRTGSAAGSYGASYTYYALAGEAIVGVRSEHKVTYGAGSWTYNLWLGNYD